MQQIFVFRLPCNACSYNHYSVLLRYRRLGYKIYVRLCTGTCCPCGTGQLFLGLYFRPVVTHCVFLNIYAVECSGNYARSKQGHWATEQIFDACSACSDSRNFNLHTHASKRNGGCFVLPHSRFQQTVNLDICGGTRSAVLLNEHCNGNYGNLRFIYKRWGKPHKVG